MACLLNNSPLLAAVLLAPACTSLGTNVSGSFRCEAPDGICAPSVAIDDRALTEIIDAEAREGAAPAGRFAVDDGEPDRTRPPDGAGPAVVTATYQLSVIFPAYTDAEGVSHERRTETAQVGLPGRTASSVELAARSRGYAVAGGLLAAAQSAPVIEPRGAADAARSRPAPNLQGVVEPPATTDPIGRIKADVDTSLRHGMRRNAQPFPAQEEDR
jgi:conjugal transfer pilus assembly protein TraV